MPKRRRPTILLDEHIRPALGEVFREVGFRTILAAGDSRYRGRDGRDEHDYIDELYAANEFFVTSDLQFADWVLKVHGTRHAGLLYLPVANDEEFRAGIAAVAAGWIWGSTDHGPFAMRGKIIYWANSGLHQLDAESRIHLAVPARLVLEAE